MRCQKVTCIVILTAAIGSVFCYENAYDLAERSSVRHGSVFGSPRFFKRDGRRRYESQTPLPLFEARFHSRPVHNTGPIFGRGSAGNGYDNLGNRGMYQHSSWADFVEPSRSNAFGTSSWGGYFQDRNLPSSERFFEDGNVFQRKTLTPGFSPHPGGVAAYPDHYLRRELDVDEPYGEKVFSRRTFLEKDGFGEGTVKILPAEVFKNVPLRRPQSVNKPEFPSVLRRRQRPRLPGLVYPRNPVPSEPAFYRKNYFRTQNVPHEDGEASVEAEDVSEDVQSTSGAEDDTVITEGGSYFSNNEDKEEEKSDAAYHNDKKGAVLDVANKQKVGEATRFDKNGGNKSTVRVNKTSKKGHTTKGFATHHHKDETGNTTTFFDESADSGGQEDYQDHEDEFGARRTMEVLNGREDGQFFKENGGRIGRFGSGLLQDKTKVEKDAVAKTNRFSQEEAFSKGKDQLNRRSKAETDYLGGGTWRESY